MYQIEQQVVEQNSIWEKIRQYVSGDGVKEQAHQVEENLFRMLLELGLSLLKEVIAQHGTGKEKKTIITKEGKEIPYHDTKSRQYLSIFGELEIETRCSRFRVSGFEFLVAGFGKPFARDLQKRDLGRKQSRSTAFMRCFQLETRNQKP